MGTIIERPRKDGSVAYMAQILLMRDRKIVHRESRTFDRRPAAAAWLKKREAELEQPGGLDAARRDKRNPTLADAINKYVGESTKEIGRTKSQVLSTIKTFDIAELPCADIRSPDIVAFARELRAKVSPQTVQNYLSHLSAVFRIARPAWGYELDYQAMRDAFTVGKALGLTGRTAKRERRPTLEELDRLMTHFGGVRQRRPSSIPMQAIITFALFSTRRLDEITRVRWADLDEAGPRILVRDMKNPGEKIGNDVWCDLPVPAARIIKAMPRGADTIFPFGGDAIGAAFTRACAFLGIVDLHFHDLRHEGVSRLFEMGLTIPHVAAVSGHRSWTSLKRYTHLRQSGDRYAGWRWLDVIAPSSPIV
jgi:integrase